MRRWSRVATLAGLLGAFQGPAIAQDGSGLVVRPPAEILADEVHPAPPIPSPPVPTPADAPTIGAGWGLQRIPDRPPAAHPGSSVDRPAVRASAVNPDGIEVRPPLNGHAPDGSDAEIQAPSVPTIAPPIGAGPIESEGRNPFLPPGPGREIADQGRSGGEEARSDRRRVARGSDPIGRERPGLFGMMFGRLAGRPSPRSTGQPGPVAPALDLDPSDPAAPEALKRQLERMIVQQEADRLSSVELLVVGPRVHIRAEAARPWQRMALRRGLERLPMPPGYHSTVEVR